MLAIDPIASRLTFSARQAGFDTENVFQSHLAKESHAWGQLPVQDTEKGTFRGSKQRLARIVDTQLQGAASQL